MYILIQMALRNLFNHKFRSSVCGILIALSTIFILGITILCFTIKDSMESAVVESCTGDLQIHNADMGDIDVYSSPVSDTPLLQQSEEISSLVKNIDGISDVASRLRVQGLLIYEEQSTGATLTGIHPDIEKNISSKIKIIEGTYITKENGMIIGRNMHDDLGISIGDTVALYTSNMEGEVNKISIVIEGVFTSDGLGMFMDNNLFANIEYVRDSTGHIDEEATEVVIRLNGTKSNEKVLKELEEIISQSSYNLRVDAWKDIAITYSSIISASILVPLALIFLIFLVVGIGLLNTVIMSILERTKETRILMALGTSRKRIIILFILEYLILGVVASLCAVIITVPIILYLGKVGIPATTSVVEYIFGGSYLYMVFKPEIALSVFIVFSLFPAIISYFAAKINTKHVSLVNIV